MINLAVINLKEFIRGIFKIFVGIIIFIIIVKMLGNIENENYTKIDNLKKSPFFTTSKIINNTILITKYYDKENIKKESGIKKILSSELAILGTEESLMEKENQEEFLEKNEEGDIILKEENENDKKIEYDTKETDVQNELQLVPEKIQTEVIKLNNKENKYTDIYKTVKIKNESKYPLTEEILNPNKELKNKNIVIYHTHTCESYTPTENNNYEASGNFRTTDLNYSVARVGKELSSNLIRFGFNVNHDTTYHDYPAYTGSYTRSLSTIKKIISNIDSELIIDLHRDALGNDSKYAPRVKVGDEIAAQLMFVIGTDGGGLEHPDWINNLKLAVKIQEKANEIYPGLFKPIILRNSRYNQHVSSGACIIEVGATGNTIEECIVSMKYLSKVINEVIK